MQHKFLFAMALAPQINGKAQDFVHGQPKEFVRDGHGNKIWVCDDCHAQGTLETLDKIVCRPKVKPADRPRRIRAHSEKL